MRRGHLSEAHNESIDPIALLKQYQDARMGDTIRLRLRLAIRNMEKIAARKEEWKKGIEWGRRAEGEAEGGRERRTEKRKI